MYCFGRQKQKLGDRRQNQRKIEIKRVHKKDNKQRERRAVGKRYEHLLSVAADHGSRQVLRCYFSTPLFLLLTSPRVEAHSSVSPTTGTINLDYSRQIYLVKGGMVIPKTLEISLPWSMVIYLASPTKPEGI